MLGVFVDLTERHHVEEELRDLGGRLINAHEQERIRLSRELHDDVPSAWRCCPPSWACFASGSRMRRRIFREQVARISTEAAGIGSELHRFSHELHPATVAADRARGIDSPLLRRTRRGPPIPVDLDIAGVPAGLGLDSALCLYRITQEALHNVVKHSGASRATVALRSDSGDVVLSVVDNGMGFDPVAVRQKDTLGLVSMRERARLVRARLVVFSKPGAGTTVEVRLPLEGER